MLSLRSYIHTLDTSAYWLYAYYRYEDVLQDCQQVLMLDAASVTARSLLGRTYKILNEHQKAEHMLSEAILLDEHTPALYTGISLLLNYFLGV